MQQMSNILLSANSKNAGGVTKDAAQVSDNQSFSSVFSQANQASITSESSKPTSQYNTSSEQALISKGVELSEPLVDADIEFIFAQLDMAQSFDKSKGDGKSLPHSDNTVVAQQAIDESFDLDSLLPFYDKKHQNKPMIESIIESSVISDEQKLFQATINPPLTGQSSSDFLSSLTFDESQKLMDFTNKDLVELQGLSPQQLADIVEEFNLQAPVIDESILALVDLDLEADVSKPDLHSIKADVLNLVSKETDKLSDVSITQNMTNTSNIDLNKQKVDADNPKNIDLNKPNVDVANAKNIDLDKLNIAQSNKPNVVPANIETKVTDTQNKSSNNSATLFASTYQQSTEQVLGDKDRVDGQIKNQWVQEVDLSKAKLSVDMVKAEVTKPVANMAMNSVDHVKPLSDIDIFGSTEDKPTELKALQNQSSFTPMHKSDVPQFQLSLKQHGESQVQMLEMIQRFSPVMRQQLITMVSNGVQQAEIRLDPAELGHLTVKIQITGDQTQVQFQVAQSQTRDLVEQSIPRLREMLAQEGLQLADSHVSQGGGGKDDQQPEADKTWSTGQEMDENSAIEHSLNQNQPQSLHSGIDYYA
ncbi:flagellar hook-length control protein FliK [Shewanella aestuarii]|uniref:Flagellar hook-length control protein-like C-terminal domain-containing protein n=1 Tax=Shewanella aestuarii TaxID=1028752 RepID=A0A6G9QJD5_9GAMM|nr:flagellar hook-length control protein FliK [Shewanella aestuarii]QIR13989.1 hypothetical protein HBH39_05310 [Shewanella aestuarii]